MDILKFLNSISGGANIIVWTVVLIFLYKNGVLQFLMQGKNGNGKDKQIEELREEISAINNNHLEHIAAKLDKVIENTNKEIILLEIIQNKLK